MLHFSRFVIAILSTALLAGCGSPVRTFNPETDTGYQVTEEEKENYYTFEDAFDDTSSFGRDAALPFLAGAAAAVFPPAAIAGGLGIGKAVESRIEATLEKCEEESCFGHQPYGDILVSGNVMRGSISDVIDPSAYFAMIDFPVEWPIFVSHDKIGLREDYLVDIYFPHTPDVERDAIRNRQMFNGMIVNVVCETGDRGCFRKYEKDADDFILGRWQTLEAYLADYEANDGFPN